MATKRKTKKKSKTAASRKVMPPKKQVRRGKAPKESAKKKAAQSKSVSKRKQLGKRAISAKAAASETAKTRKKRQAPDELTFPRERSGEQSGDLQGLSDVESADSESVDELIEEGNAFEAGVVSGVEDAGDRDEKAVRTREVSEDDVPGEYLDED